MLNFFSSFSFLQTIDEQVLHVRADEVNCDKTRRRIKFDGKHFDEELLLVTTPIIIMIREHLHSMYRRKFI